MVLDSGVDIEGTALASRSTRLIATTQTDLDSLLSICPKDFWGSAHRYDTRKSRITISFRVGYT
jgi:hypothetical protein